MVISMEYMSGLMFFLLLFLIIIGFPITFAFFTVSLIFSLIFWGIMGPNILVSAIWGSMNNFVLVATPLFIFMALILEKSDIVSDLYDAFYKWSGKVRGGLAVATILVGAFLGAVSGVVAAGVIGLTLIGLPQMLKYGYDKKISLGTILAGGTLGQLIPPSTNMVVYGAITSISVGGLFLGGISSGLALAAMYCAYILIRNFINKDMCPALPPEARATTKEKIMALRKVAFPFLLIISVLGSIVFGIASPTEAAAVGAVGAVLFSVIKNRMTLSILRSACIETLGVTGMVGWLIASAASFGGVFAGIGGNMMVTQVALSLPGGKWAVLLLAVLFVFFLGMFLETTAIIMLAAPILSPIMVQLGFDPLWWGIMFMVLLQMSYVSPPIGLSLFYMMSVTPKEVTTRDVFASAIPFLLLQFAMVLMLIIFPQIALYLPKLLSN